MGAELCPPSGAWESGRLSTCGTDPTPMTPTQLLSNVMFDFTSRNLSNTLGAQIAVAIDYKGKQGGPNASADKH